MVREALGLIETNSFIAAIEVANAMIEAADVQLVKKTCIGSGVETVMVHGDAGAVKEAVEAGAARACRIGELVRTYIIPKFREEEERE